MSIFAGDPLYVGFDLTIASFDSISEVSMVSNARNKMTFRTHNYTSCFQALCSTAMIWNKAI